MAALRRIAVPCHKPRVVSKVLPFFRPRAGAGAWRCAKRVTGTGTGTGTGELQESDGAMEEFTVGRGTGPDPQAKTDGGQRVQVRRSARARRLTLRVSRVSGAVTLTLPKRTPLRDGVAFANSRADWIAAQIAGLAPVTPLVFGAAFPFRGEAPVLTPARVRSPRLDGDALLMPDDPARLSARLKAFCRTEARSALADACDRYSAALGLPYARLTLRDTRSRWGSCSSRGDLMFSWRLIIAPPEILEYVAAHEVAHLDQMNHSPAFWATCGRLYPDYARARAWLRREGDTLHRVAFDG